jgi:hypothetical protein
MSCNTRIAGTVALGAALLIAVGLSTSPAQAAFVVTLTQEGPNVVAIGSGTINTTGLSFYYSQNTGVHPFVEPQFADIVTGQFPSAIDVYESAYAGPTSFGSGYETGASSGSGSIVGIYNHDIVVVPYDYRSGSPLMDTATYDNATFSSLGVTPGTYVWSWGSGLNADSFTLTVGAAAVSEPSTLDLMTLGLLGAGFARRKRPN